MRNRVGGVHKVVATVAKEAAGQLYETVMGDNVIYTEWKRQNPNMNAKQLEKRFIDKNWGKCIEFARATLSLMLNNHSLPEKVREDIYEALVLDNTLVVGRKSPAEAKFLLSQQSQQLVNEIRKGTLN